MNSTVRALAAPVLAAFALAATSAPVLAGGADPAKKGSVSQEATGAIEIHGGGVALGVGVSWGKGTLTYRGEKHALKVNGLSAVDIGASGFTASGTVSNLKQLSDIEGTYQAASLGATVAGGGSVSTMKNDKGVVIKVNATSRGLRLTAAPSGVKIQLAK
ncbi:MULTISPECIES: hypothetical protein [unclassified Caulobacter]|uniref:hypothetical protein n=1 Tax=unclassified Caulobacter TaxID=2648921 RepID=UPI00068A1E64|nr:hypothetical protein [Caulobacter sp. UNC358MFTsu5.1]